MQIAVSSFITLILFYNVFFKRFMCNVIQFINIVRFRLTMELLNVNFSIVDYLGTDFFFLTAWNYKDEIIKKLRSTGNYNTRFIIPFPNVHIN